MLFYVGKSWLCTGKRANDAAPELYERGNQIIGCHSGVAVRLQPRC